MLQTLVGLIALSLCSSVFAGKAHRDTIRVVARAQPHPPNSEVKMAFGSMQCGWSDDVACRGTRQLPMVRRELPCVVVEWIVASAMSEGGRGSDREVRTRRSRVVEVMRPGVAVPQHR